MFRADANGFKPERRESLQRHTHRPSYEWIRTLAVAELPHHSDHVRPEFWKSIEAGVSRLKPSQRKVYDLYRCGLTVPSIATLMGWKKRSVYVALSQIDDALRLTVPIQNG